MRRPLCCVCLAFVAAVFLYLLAGMLPTNAVVETEGSRLTLMGELYNKEYKNDSLLLYLKHVKKINQNSADNVNPISNQQEIIEYKNDTCVMCYVDNSGISYENEPKMGA